MKTRGRFGKISRGGRVLRKIEAELSMDDWNTPEEIIQEFNGALGLDENRQLKGR